MKDEPIILTMPRWSLLGAVVIPLAFGGTAFWFAISLIRADEPRSVANGIALCIPAIVLIVLGLWAICRLLGSRRIEIGPAGLRLPHSRSVVAWSDLAPFELVYQRKKLDLWAPGKVRFDYHDTPPGKAFARWSVKPMAASPSMFSRAGVLSTAYLRPKGVVQGPEELVAVLEHWRTRYAARD